MNKIAQEKEIKQWLLKNEVKQSDVNVVEALDTRMLNRKAD